MNIFLLEYRKLVHNKRGFKLAYVATYHYILAYDTICNFMNILFAYTPWNWIHSHLNNSYLTKPTMHVVRNKHISSLCSRRLSLFITQACWASYIFLSLVVWGVYICLIRMCWVPCCFLQPRKNWKPIDMTFSQYP